jgi:hypothetical protein
MLFYARDSLLLERQLGPRSQKKYGEREREERWRYLEKTMVKWMKTQISYCFAIKILWSALDTAVNVPSILWACT